MSDIKQIKGKFVRDITKVIPMPKSEANRRLDQIIDLAIAEERKRVMEIDENTSDGYHTFKELYEYRKIYNALVFNDWSKQGIYNVHKSKKHSDGELCFGGSWFIVVAELPTGQISNHYELKDWDLFKCEEKEIPNQYDGHSPQDVTQRIINLITNTNK